MSASWPNTDQPHDLGTGYSRATPGNIIHETCHIVAFHLHGPAIKPHGIEWKAAMANCGLEPVRCHDIPLIGINHFNVRECPKAERCIVSRKDFGLMNKSDYTLHCTICGMRVDEQAIES